MRRPDSRGRLRCRRHRAWSVGAARRGATWWQARVRRRRTLREARHRQRAAAAGRTHRVRAPPRPGGRRPTIRAGRASEGRTLAWAISDEAIAQVNDHFAMLAKMGQGDCPFVPFATKESNRKTCGGGSPAAATKPENHAGTRTRHTRSQHPRTARTTKRSP